MKFNAKSLLLGAAALITSMIYESIKDIQNREEIKRTVAEQLAELGYSKKIEG